MTVTEPSARPARFDIFDRDCPSRTAFAHATGRWGALSLAALVDGPQRFNALRRRVDGVSEKMLAQTLQSLEADGMVLREAKATIPPHVEYSLTALGMRAGSAILDLMSVLEEGMPEVMASRRAHE